MSANPGRGAIVAAIESTGVVAVVRLKDASAFREVAAALVEGGVRAIEVTMTVPRAVSLIEELAASAPADVIVGAGTVLDVETARQVILAGARFVVGPVLRPDVIELGHRYDVPVMPGCFTPTEILTAWEAGADIVKVFPVTALGPGFFKDVRGPLPQVRLMPTGGVTRENAGEWIGRDGTGRRERRVGGPLRSADGERAAFCRRGAGGTRASTELTDVEGRVLRRDHAALESARVRALLPVPGARGNLRRR